MSDVEVYTFGLVAASVCAPSELPRDEVLAGANAAHPTGLSWGWKFSDEPTFAGGQPNPCQCDQNPDRLHYLLEC